jgi:hypothetical protein
MQKLSGRRVKNKEIIIETSLKGLGTKKINQDGDSDPGSES